MNSRFAPRLAVLSGWSGCGGMYVTTQDSKNRSVFEIPAVAISLTDPKTPATFNSEDER